MLEEENLTIEKIRRGLLKKEFSAQELARFFLGKIEEGDKKIFSFLTITSDLALKEAKEIDDLISQGKEIPSLAAVPGAIKDNILIEGVRCTAGSKILENYKASYDATVVKKLKASGALILGKTNLDEFAMGSSTENSAFGPTRNPYDLERVPGGSSGGSAAAVAAGFSLFALGSDTGGSVRQPASFCGVVGLKPTYGAVSRYGLIAFSSSLDQIGVFSQNVADCRTIFRVIRGRDENDSTSISYPPNKIEVDLKKIKVGVPKEYFVQGIQPAVKDVIEKAVKKYESNGVKVEEVSLPHTKYALADYYIIAPAEASSNLARYDGVKYGLRKKGRNLLETYLQTRSKGFGKEVRRRIMLGSYSLSSGFYDAYYLRAQKVRTKIKEDFQKVLQKVDFILSPVSPTVAFKIGEKTTDPLSMYLSDILTVPVSLAGLPALSLPVGKVGNLPVGLQIIANPFEEEKIMQFGEFYESF